MSNFICEELVAIIFECLPSKSLIQFRSLSKSWYSRISSPDFIRKHTLRSVRNPQNSLLKQEIQFSKHDIAESCTQIDIPSSREFLINNFDIVGSCNGIICLVEKKFNISLWNPSIRCKLTLRHHPFTGSSLANGFGFDPKMVVGFGFDPISDDYKIVRISYSYGGLAKDSIVYTLKTGAWSAIASPTNVLHNVRSPVCCVNGVLHWMDTYNILTFDLSNHVFGTISFPLWVPITIQGSIAPWNNDWIKVITKRHSNVSSFSMYLWITGKGLLEAYNPETGVCTKLVHLTASRFSVETSMCVESLELLNMGTPCNGFVGTIGKNMVGFPMQFSRYSRKVA